MYGAAVQCAARQQTRSLPGTETRGDRRDLTVAKRYPRSRCYRLLYTRARTNSIDITRLPPRSHSRDLTDKA